MLYLWDAPLLGGSSQGPIFLARSRSGQEWLVDSAMQELRSPSVSAGASLAGDGKGSTGVSRDKSKPDSVCCVFLPVKYPIFLVFFFYFRCLVSVIKNKSTPTPFCSQPFPQPSQ